MFTYIVEQTRIVLAVLIRLVTLITVGVHKAHPDRITWPTEPTPYIKTLPKRALFWWTTEILANCKRITFKIWHVVKILAQNLTRCIFLKSKYDALFFLIQKMVRCFFSFQNLTQNENFNSKSYLLRKPKKCKICRFHGVKWTKTCFFWMQTSF